VTRDQWSGVRELVARFAALPEAVNVFGANGHEWSLEPPLTTAELAVVEAQLQVELPDEYRSFLAEVGRGGAGPAYGLFPLRCVDGQWRWEGDGAELTNLETLAEPFPHMEAFNPAEGLPKQPDKYDYDSEEAFLEAEEAYFEQHDAVVFRPEHSVGLLYLCHLGCALREALVVSGAARGQMWADNTADDLGFAPLLDDAGIPLGFAQWYWRWLDGAAAQLPSDLDA